MNSSEIESNDTEIISSSSEKSPTVTSPSMNSFDMTLGNESRNEKYKGINSLLMYNIEYSTIVVETQQLRL